MSLIGVIGLLDRQGAVLAAKLKCCSDAAATARKTLDGAGPDCLRRELDHLLGALPGAIETGRLLGRMEATAHLLKIADAGGPEALAAEFETGDANDSPR